MQQTQVITVTKRLTSDALLYEMSSCSFVPMNLSRNLCLVLIWLTKNEEINSGLIINILLTCVPHWAKIQEAEHCIDEEEAAHLDLCLLVSPSILLD